MMKKIGFLFVWLGFIAYAFLLAPPEDPNTSELIQNLSAMEIEGINPLIVSLFNLMGVLPLMYAPLLLIDGKGQKLVASPFVILSFAVGAFALLPYFAFREPELPFPGKKSWLLKVLDSRVFGILLTTAFLLILIPGLSNGNWNDFFIQWQNSRFIHVMSLDFCLLVLLFPAILKTDLIRRGISDSPFFSTLIWIPLVGTLLYFCTRPPLMENEALDETKPRSQVTQS
ncbi:MAG: DUF2834 domain-containing protein [Cyanobacteria bacterium]|jgi:hypothetical protein|nr:DUF2834 domain-containing protein [Cyanobacteria bacterium GSL.Bin21]